jgi:hypothetical protein
MRMCENEGRVNGFHSSKVHSVRYPLAIGHVTDEVLFIREREEKESGGVSHLIQDAVLGSGDCSI